VLLARVAEQLYWAARYVERAEMTARVVSEHTHLLVDLPVTVPLTWEPLLDVPGTHGGGPGPGTTEREIVAHLLADPDNPSSVLASVVTARTNLRSAREVLSREAWEAVNNLYLYVTSHHSEGIDRWSRGRFLDRVIAEAQRFDGIVGSTMSRDATYQFLRLGRSLERADMTGRVLDARAVPLLGGYGAVESHTDVQWAALLRSLSALQAYYQRKLAPVSGASAVGLVLHDPDVPSSLAHCLAEVAATLAELPRSEAAAAAARVARRTLVAVTGRSDRLHDDLIALRLDITALNAEIQATYFPPQPVPEPEPAVVPSRTD
jgi:uncharacterized alpha-E superfamily protein